MRTRLALVVPILCLLALVPSATPAAQPPAAQPAPQKATGLEAVPTDALGFLTVNVGKLWDNPSFKPLRDWFAAQKIGPTDDVFGVPAGDIERITLFVTSIESADRGGPLVLVTTKKPYNEAKVLKTLQIEERDSNMRRSGRAVRTNSDKFEVLVFADDRTLLFLPKVRDDGAMLAEYLGQLIAKKTDGALANALADASKHDIALAVDTRSLGAFFQTERNQPLTPYLALFKARSLTFAADFGKTAHGSLKLGFANAADAKRAGPVLKEGMTDLADQMEKELARRKDRVDPIEKMFLETAVSVLKAGKVETDDTSVFALADIPYQDAITKFAAALPKSYSAAVTSVKGQNNLKQLALAMHNFESANQVFPGDVVPFGEKMNAWSWRVQLLPYIEQDNLYRVLDFTKAWDDPANVKILEKFEMPKVFEIPGRPAPKGETYFRVISRPKNAKGTDRPWLIEGQRGPRIADITDGTSNTLMIVEAAESVPWYKADVLAYDGKLPLPQLGDKASERFLVAFGDGSVRLLRRDRIDEKTLRALITIQGGEVVNLP